MNLRAAATVASVALLLMIGVAVGSVTGLDALAEDDTTLLRTVALGFVVIAILDVVVAWALWVFLRPVDDAVAALAAWFRTGYAVVLATVALGLLEGADDPGRVQAVVDDFRERWDGALAIFGLHLLVVGWLAVRATYVPTWLGALVALAGVGYVVDGVGTILGSEPGLATFTFFGEVVLMIWLWVKGRRVSILLVTPRA